MPCAIGIDTRLHISNTVGLGLLAKLRELVMHVTVIWANGIACHSTYSTSRNVTLYFDFIAPTDTHTNCLNPKFLLKQMYCDHVIDCSVQLG